MPDTVLHLVSDFIEYNYDFSDSSANYWYEGYCPQNGKLKLPRNSFIEAIAHSLMQHLGSKQLYSREGKMYGVLLVELQKREKRVLKAFSGLLNGQSVVEGWVPPIPGRDRVALEEAHTLAQLETIKQELIALKQLPERNLYKTYKCQFDRQLQEMSDRHQDCKHQRHEKRQIFEQMLTSEALADALEQLNEESRQQGIERRQLKRSQNEVLQPLEQLIAAADGRMQELKQQRKILSRTLQEQLYAAYSLTNFSGQSLSLQQLMPGGMPTGTGDCCAPKLLHYAATHSLKPLAMAEFWWGPSLTNLHKQGEFYGACAERCQPLMGFLLSGLPQTPVAIASSQLPILYEDEWLIAVNKPAGILSVPGRYSDRQDSVLSRLRNILPNGMALTAVHRLDQETSGILLLARNQQTLSQLSQQFQQRQVYKVYEAILSGALTTNEGTIELPLWGDPQNRPYQKVDWQQGLPSLTRFRVIAREADYTRVEFTPLTGRTHQLRVHAADSQGLGIPILGDRLYGCRAVASRLHLHASVLRFEHPQLGKILHLQAEVTF